MNLVQLLQLHRSLLMVLSKLVVKLAAFGEDGVISALDDDGTTFFPGGVNIYELSSME